MDDGVGHSLAAQRQAWLQMMHGSAQVNGEELSVGDGLALTDVNRVSIRATSEISELLLFDMAAA